MQGMHIYVHRYVFLIYGQGIHIYGQEIHIYRQIICIYMRTYAGSAKGPKVPHPAHKYRGRLDAYMRKLKSNNFRKNVQCNRNIIPVDCMCQ